MSYALEGVWRILSQDLLIVIVVVVVHTYFGHITLDDDLLFSQTTKPSISCDRNSLIVVITSHESFLSTTSLS